MASSYDIDTSVRINGGLTVNGDTSIPSSNLNVGANITGNANLYIAGTITGNTINSTTANITNINATGTISGNTVNGNTINGSSITSTGTISATTLTGNTINGSTANITNINSTGTISGNILEGNGSSITSLSSSAMTDVLLLNGTRSMAGNLVMPIYQTTGNMYSYQIDFRDQGHFIKWQYYFDDNVTTLDGLRIAGYQGIELYSQGYAKQLAYFKTTGASINYPLSVSGNTTVNGTLTATSNVIATGVVSGSTISGNGSSLIINNNSSVNGGNNAISTGWAYTHENKIGSLGHIPSGGTNITFLRGDNTWVTPTDSYVTGISSTSGGNGILTVSRNSGLGNLTLDLTHNHDSQYLGISGTAVNATSLNNLSSSQFVRNDSATTMGVGLLFGATATGGVTASTPTALSYGVLQSYATLNILADTDGTHTEFIYLSAGYPTGASTNGLAIGYNLANFTWKGNTIWHAGNDGSGSGLDADTTDGYHMNQGLRTTDNPSFYGMTALNGLNTNYGVTMATAGSANTGINILKTGTAHIGFKWDGTTFALQNGSASTSNADLWGGPSYFTVNTSTSTFNITTTNLQHNGNKIWDAGNGGAGSGLDADLLDGINSSQFTRNDLANQSVNTGFTMSGNAYVGMSNSSGALYVRTGTGSLGIQIAGDNGAQQAGVGAYINANGTANFNGTMTANAIAVTSTALVTNLNSQMINSVKEPQLAKNYSVAELGGKGVYTGLQITAQSVPNMTTQIGAGTVYTDSGMRVVIPSGTSVAFATASATYNRIDSVYVQGSSAGANEGVVTVATGVASSSPVPPAIPSDAVLLANVTIRQNAGSILSTDITDMRVWRPLYNSGGDTYLRNNLYVQGQLNSTNGFITINQPIKNTPSNNSVTIPSGSTSYTWTHNLNLTNYIVKLSCNNTEPHVSWSNKTANAITINLDTTYDTATIVDIGIEAF